jgi:hypothetical protein
LSGWSRGGEFNVPHSTDLDLTAKDVSELASPDAISAFLTKLGYDTADRTLLSPEAVGLTGESANAIKRIELLSEDPEQFLRVIFAQPKSLTAKVRNDLVRVLGKSNLDHLLVLASDFDALEFVFLDKRKREQKGPASGERIQVVPKVFKVDRRHSTPLERRILRRFTWTCRDALEQFDKLRSVFDAAAYTGEYFQNRGLFSDYYLRDRLREDLAWRDNPSEMFSFVRDLMRDKPSKWTGKDKDTLRSQLLEPLFKKLGFKPTVNRPSKTNQTEPDYILKGSDNGKLTAAFVYSWDRWLDGPDLSDTDTPDENPGACVVTALDAMTSDWIIVTNGRLWRLYSRQAHARATNFYEVDLVEALTASGDTDPNEAFRYWWLFLRPAAFVRDGSVSDGKCWLDDILLGSREYAKRLGDRLKDRIFLTIFPHLAQGFLEDRKHRLAQGKSPTDEELSDIFEATLTLLYRLLFLLYAESRDLLPIREAPYQAASLKKNKDEIADKAGVAEGEVLERMNKAYSAKETTLYERLCKLFQAMDKGDPILNVPTYNGGLFNTSPLSPPAGRGAGGEGTARGQRIAQFLLEHKVPDRFLALAIDRLARDQDERTLALVFIDYKSLEVRHLGSIYEGLLEFKLKVADEDLATQADKKGERYIPLSQAKVRKGRQVSVVVRKKEVYLSNDKSERKASGSYYTPDPIVEYIVANTVGPVLEEKLEALRGEFRKVRRTFDSEFQKSKAYPSNEIKSGKLDHRQWAGLQTYNAHKDLVESLFDLRVLDPAMGSGHFLVETVDYVTDQLLKFLNQFPINPVNFALDRTRTSILESLGEQGVTVDPKKLTDINLLKRHVLKRCIYGVDLNPMAVELAKVSLWLDAFTLGAPLNFLDHHLRCGNSLIGATFKDLEEARRGQLFGMPTEKLLMAITQVLELSRLADATAAEVAQSATQYDKARHNLVGYRLILDCLAARFFGIHQAAELVKFAHILNLDSAEQFQASFRDENERRFAAEVETLAHRPDLRFFHWEIEFPEVFFVPFGALKQQVRHKDDLAAGSAGFDAVVGNPPYVRMELIKPLKPFLKTHYICHAERADLFIYFYERALQLLHVNGRTAFIASSTWTKTKAGEGLRKFLKNEHTLVSFLDFGDLPVFEDATTYPCILVAERGKPEPTHEVQAAVVRDLAQTNYDELFPAGVHIAQASLDPAGWRFEDERLIRLFEKIRGQGVPLKEYCGSPLYGIKTGLNEAFVISNETRDRLVAEDPRSKEIVKPFLEGKDLKPWRYEWRGIWLIYTHHGIEIKHYPGILAYLKTFKSRLEARATSDHHAWYELQQPQERFTPMMKNPKIMYPDITVEPRFVFDDKGFYFSNTTYFLPGADRYLQGLLSSPVTWWYLSHSVRLMRGGYLRLFTQYVEGIPIVTGAKPEMAAIATISEKLSLPATPNRLALEQELQDRVAALYRVTEEERKIMAGLLPARQRAVTEIDKED